MTRDEFKILVKGMKAVYTQQTFIPDADAFNVWFSMLEDIEYSVASVSIQVYMMQNRFPPTIADIREMSSNMKMGQQANASEAWDMVYKALCNSTYNSEFEFMKLPPMVQKAVGSASQLRQWAIDENFNAGVESSNFKRVYAQVQEREKKQAQLSIGVNDKIAELTGNAIKMLENRI